MTISSTPSRIIQPAQATTTASKVKQFAAETSSLVVTSIVSMGVFGALGLGFKVIGAALSSTCTIQNACRMSVLIPTGKITSLVLNKLAKQPKPETNISQAINVISASAAAIASSKFLKHGLGYDKIRDDASTIAFTTASFFVISKLLMEFTNYEKLQRELNNELDTLEESGNAVELPTA